MFLILGLLVFINSSFFQVAVGSCQLDIVSKSMGTRQLQTGDSFKATCKFTTTCRVDVYASFKSFESSDYASIRPVSDPFWYWKEGLDFKETVREIQKNRRYEVDFMLKKFRVVYTGILYCVIEERSNSTNFKQERIATITTYQFDEVDPHRFCFSPIAKNITAVPTYYSNGSLSLTLYWNISTKEISSAKYCIGSTKWKVRYQSYSNVKSTPPDEHIDTVYRYDWIYVQGTNKFYKFKSLFNNYTYYQFQLESRPVDMKKLKKSGSHIFYFGKQEIPNILNKQERRWAVNQFGSITIPCIATGTPSPTVNWISSNGIIGRDLPGQALLNLFNVTFSYEGHYFCVADNTIVNPPQGKTHKFDVWSIEVNVKTFDSLNGVFCDSAFSSSHLFCQRYLHSEFPIYTNLTATADRNELSGEKMTIINQYIPPGNCRDFAYSILCHTLYPYCDVSQSVIPKPRLICSQSCNQFINTHCSEYTSKMKKENINLYQLLVSHCDDSGPQGGSSPECIPLSIDSSKNDQTATIIDTGLCVKGNGRGYSGNQIHTESNLLCQQWSKQYPHKHPMLPTIYASELANADYVCRNPGGLGSRPWCYTTDPFVRWEYCSIPKCDTCEVYIGSVCSGIQGYNYSKVFVRKGKDINSWEDIERKILHALTGSQFHPSTTQGCYKLFQILLCHSSFPICNINNTPMSLCMDHCRLLKSLKVLCANLYEEYLNFVHQNTGFVSIIDCHANCSIHSLEVPLLSNEVSDPANSTDNCYNGEGINYRGDVSIAINTLTCQPWNSTVLNFNKFPKLSSNNYCRNPWKLLNRPWCFINYTSWQYCDIPHCTAVLSTSNTTSIVGITSDTGSSKLNELAYVFSGILIVFVASILFSLFSIIYFLRKKKKLNRRKSYLDEITYTVNQDYCSSTIDNIPENFHILEPKQIKYMRQIGRGNFGIVFKGQGYNIRPDEEVTEVAVKTLKDDSIETLQNFIDEAKVMFSFDHPNILTIFGVCMTEMPYQMVFEYMDQGDLTQYLRMKASGALQRLLYPFNNNARTGSSYSNHPPLLNTLQLLNISKQICNGMKYLAEKKYVHRDLACRNCLVKSDLIVKIGDFGMSRNLYSKDYYRINGNAVLPVRWMSPESIIYGKFSVEGDVWSFGVVMWEVYSFALQPYYGISNEGVTEAIRHGKTLDCPEDCPTEIYKIMKDCWIMDPNGRPTFNEIYEELSYYYQDENGVQSCSSYDSDAFYSEDIDYD